MKRKLLLLVLFLGTSYFAKSQVIDVIGKGIHDMTSASLSLTDVDNIDSVRVGAIYSWDRNAQPNGVVFKDFNGATMPTSLKSNIVHKGTTTTYIRGAYYTAMSDNITGDEISLEIRDDHKDHVHSAYAFIYRDVPSPTYKSFASLETVYFWQNSSVTVDGDDRYGPYVYEIPIDKAASSRNIKVKIPITELEDDNRVGIIDITAGDKKHHAEITTYNNPPLNELGNSFLLGEYIIPNVSGDVDKILVSIYSPSIDGARTSGYDNPDSFYTSGVVVDVDIVEEGCTLTQGYWKTHSACKAKGPKRDNTWDKIGEGDSPETTTNFFISDQTYCEVFDTQPNKKNGKYYILAHQYIAAQLNIFAGANPTEAQLAYIEATKFLEKHTPGNVKGIAELESKCVELGGILADFNEGEIGPGHCDGGEEEEENEEDEAEIQPVDEELVKVKMFPNPASAYSKIAFTPKQNGNTRVEMYNINGQKVAVLYNKKTQRNVPITIEYNTDRFKKGLYFVIIRNGSDVYKEKISILN